MVDGQHRIISTPPTIVPVEEIYADVQAAELYKLLHTVLGKYRRTLQSDRRHLLEQFAMVQVARKVVGVGGVGTRAWIVLMEADDGIEPLFLQAKEAQPSVLAQYAGRSVYNNQGERVVAGQHLMQAQSDIFLGWTRVAEPLRHGVERDFYDAAEPKDLEVLRAGRDPAPAGHDDVRPAVRAAPWPGAHARSAGSASPWPPTSAARPKYFDQAIADFAGNSTLTRTKATTPRSRPPRKKARSKLAPRSRARRSAPASRPWREAGALTLAEPSSVRRRTRGQHSRSACINPLTGGR